jgi:sugar/nucleoside kinase (ribokinase family)
MTARVVCLGAHIVDILGRPVTDIPPGQSRRVLEEIKITAAGTAAGTAVDLAKLGAQVTSMGAIGSDRLADFLSGILREYGIDTAHLVRDQNLPTPATILPIRPNGERPALHAPGAMASLTAEDVDLSVIAEADLLHVGGPDVLGRFATTDLPGIMRFAREHGVVTTMDVLSVGDDQTLERLAPALAWTQYFMPNDDQLRAITGEPELTDAAARIRALGVACVVVTLGAQGSLVISGDETLRVPALDVPVVDTTGCGDAYCAGFITALLDGQPPAAAARFGTAAAALVAGGLGSDAGIIDRDQTLAFLNQAADALPKDETAPAPPG